MKSKKPAFTVITLGCPRNYVDSQYWIKQYINKGYDFVYSPEEADLVFINTCGFIEPAVKESIDVILEMERLYKIGQIKELVIAGCLVSRYGKELRKEFPYAKLVNALPVDRLSYKDIVPIQEGGFAYVKIAEGCRKRCSFCTIPAIRGKLSSRRIEDIVNEIKFYENIGKSEVIIVAQDTTSYGVDLYGRPALVRLLKEILKSTSVPWIRLMYTYPSFISDELLDLIAENSRILNYLDVPIQHIDDKILDLMGRGYHWVDIERLFLKAKERNISIRTTVIVGFPGEDRKTFSRLKKFLGMGLIDRLGVFKYYREKGSKAYHLGDPIKSSVKAYRYRVIYKLGKEILIKVRRSLDRRKERVIIDGRVVGQENLYIGRTYRDAPEVDDLVWVRSDSELFSGDIVDVKFVFDKESGELFADYV